MSCVEMRGDVGVGGAICFVAKSFFKEEEEIGERRGRSTVKSYINYY
jgi:hypothetical protein